MADGTPAGKLVVVLAAGRTPGKRFVFEQLASMGCVVAAVDEPGAWAACLAGEGGLLTHFLTCELSARDDAAALADVLQALRTLPR